jgi:hypothetical protein
MQTVKQSPSEDLWLAPSSQVHRTIQFIEPTVTANDFEALQPVSGQDGLRRAIQKAASWLIVETVFGLAAYGAAAHACAWPGALTPLNRPTGATDGAKRAPSVKGVT